MSGTVTIVPARRGHAVRVPHGAVIEIINPAGSQVVDTWALRSADPAEHLSMEHTRTTLGRLIPRAGDSLFSSARRPMLTFVADTSPGIHDTLIASCDAERYRMLGYEGYHDNCHDNFLAALAELGLTAPPVPAPLNLFMNVPWSTDGSLRFEEPRSRPGDLVRLRAETDLIVIMSACPQDLIPVNGHAQQPSEVHFRLLSASGEEVHDAGGVGDGPRPADRRG
ncbi:MAG TPA: urea carboxylase-associated family protein [Trebonia sp.]